MDRHVTLRMDPISDIDLGNQLTEAIDAKRTNLLNILLYGVAISFTSLLVATFIFQSPIAEATNQPVITVLLFVILWGLALGKGLSLAVRAWSFIALITALVVVDLGARGFIGQSQIFLLLLVLLICTFFGYRAGVVALGVGVAMFVATGLLMSWNIIVPPADLISDTMEGRHWFSTTVRFAAYASLITLLGYSLIVNTNMVLRRQQNLTSAIIHERELLEARVASRTQALSLVAAVNRTLSTVLHKGELIGDVVEQIKAAFNYYHVHIYLLDEKTNILRMAGGTGETGRALLLGNHKLTLDQGLVGKAAKQRRPVIVSDVSKDSTWRPNPLLPETKSEIAVPIIINNRLVGVLDVQHNVIGRLTANDAALLESIANQTAIALRNADLYSSAQGVAHQQARVNEMGQRIQLAYDVDSVLQTAVQELGRVLPVQRASATVDLQPLIQNQEKNGVRSTPEAAT